MSTTQNRADFAIYCIFTYKAQEEEEEAGEGAEEGEKEAGEAHSSNTRLWGSV